MKVHDEGRLLVEELFLTQQILMEARCSGQRIIAF